MTDDVGNNFQAAMLLFCVWFGAAAWLRSTTLTLQTRKNLVCTCLMSVTCLLSVVAILLLSANSDEDKSSPVVCCFIAQTLLMERVSADLSLLLSCPEPINKDEVRMSSCLLLFHTHTANSEGVNMSCCLLSGPDLAIKDVARMSCLLLSCPDVTYKMKPECHVRYCLVLT